MELNEEVGRVTLGIFAIAVTLPAIQLPPFTQNRIRYIKQTTYSAKDTLIISYNVRNFSLIVTSTYYSQKQTQCTFHHISSQRIQTWVWITIWYSKRVTAKYNIKDLLKKSILVTFITTDCNSECRFYNTRWHLSQTFLHSWLQLIVILWLVFSFSMAQDVPQINEDWKTMIGEATTCCNLWIIHK